MTPQIVELGRGHITLRLGERSATIEGELLVKGAGVPDFVAYSDTLTRWDPPQSGPVMTEAERAAFLVALVGAGEARGLEIELGRSTD